MESPAIASDTGDFFLAGQEWVFHLDVTSWGWIHLIIGLIMFLLGIGIFSGNVLARTVGVGVAGLSALANFMALPYYPVWSIVVIAIDVAIVWALIPPPALRVLAGQRDRGDHGCWRTVSRSPPDSTDPTPAGLGSGLT